jgi:carboxyl-terminal processing protease
MRGTDNGQLTLTIGKYYRVTGESTQHRGVIPDIELPSMVDPETVGESTRDTALPWDRIQPTRFRPNSTLATYMAELRAHQQSRAANDPDFGYLLSDVAAFKEINAQKSVSLNLETRIAENQRVEEGRLDRENARRSALGLEPVTSVEEITETETSDQIVLQQAARVVAEIAAHARSVP